MEIKNNETKKIAVNKIDELYKKIARKIPKVS